MPINEETDRVYGQRAAYDAAFSTAYTFGEIVGATFEQENTVANVADWLARDRDFQPDPDFDPAPLISQYGLEDDAANFLEANSRQEFFAKLGRREEENERRDIMMSGNGFETLAAGLGVGLVDPVNFIPVGGTAYHTYRTTGRILEGAGRTAFAGLASSAAAEAILQGTQETRTWQESGANIAASTLLSGALGGAASAFSRVEYDGLANALDRELRVPVSPAMKRDIYLKRLAEVESNNDPNAQNPRSSAKGLFQFIDSTAAQYGLTNPFDPAAARDAANRLTDDNAAALQKALGREPTFGEMYLAHQQGAAGAAKILLNPDARAVDVVGRDQVLLNGGTEDMTAGQFAQLWTSKFEEIDDYSPMNDWDEGAVTISAADAEYDSSVGAMQNKPNRAQLQLKSMMGAEKYLAFQSPLTRTLTSSSLTTRRYAQELVRSPFQYEGNALGIASPVAVETRIDAWDTPLANSIRAMDEEFVKYRTGGPGGAMKATAISATDLVTGGRSGKLTAKQFREEVGKAMRRDQQHEIPEVAAAAQYFRKNLFDPLKEAAIKAGLLPEDVSIDTAISYLSRVYNHEKIIAQRPEFRRRLSQWMRMTDERGFEDQEFDAIADEVIDRILGTPDGRLPYDISVDVPGRRGGKKGESGFTKTRSLTIPDEMIEEFLESDIELIGKIYKASMAPDVEIAGRFGSIDMVDQVKEVTDSWNKKIAGAKSEKERTRLNKLKENDIRDLAAMRDRLRGTYMLPQDPNSVWIRGFRASRQLNLLSKLGGRVVSSLPDVGRPVMQEGLYRVMRSGLAPMIKQSKSLKIAKKEAAQLGSIADFILQSRTNNLGETMNMYGRNSKFERALNGLTDTFGLATLAAPWDQFIKEFSGVVTMTRILDESRNWTNGKIRKGEMEKLTASGIDRQTAERIAKQFEKFGYTEDGVNVANAAEWDDPIAYQAMKDAMTRESRNTVITPGAGQRPLWMSSEAGKMIGQFKSFSMASSQSVLMAGLQRRDAATVNGLALSVGVGMLVYAIKSAEAGRETSDDPRKWIAEGIDRSGVTGWFFDVNNVVEKATRGRVGVSSVTGGQMMSRYASRNVVGALLGPTFGQASDIVQITGSAFAGDWKESDTRAGGRLMPYRNLIGFRHVADKLENLLNEALVE